MRASGRRVDVMQKQQTTGFTLIELSVVILTMAVLVAILLPVFAGIARSNNQHTCANNLQNLGVLLAQYRQDNGVYPAAPLPTYLRTLNPVSLPFSDANALVSATVFTLLGTTALPNETSGECQPSLYTANVYRGTLPAEFQVQIDSTATTGTGTDTFRWSADDGQTWTGNQVAITANTAQWLNGGVQVTFGHATGHQLGDTWTFTVAPITGVLPAAQVPMPIPLTAPAQHTATVSVSSTVGLTPGMNVLLHDYNRESAIGEAATIQSVSPINNTVTFTASLQQSYAADPNPDTNDPNYAPFGVLDPRVGNFGLATLYYQDPYTHPGAERTTLLTDNASIERTFSPSSYHCPQITSTEGVNPNANLKTAMLSGVGQAAFRRIDPLWSGVNTYDTTYNYDQYERDIYDYDAAVYGTSSATSFTTALALDNVRQLKNPNAPADTVVCWCYGHRSGQQPTYPMADARYPDLTMDATMSSSVLAANLRRFETNQRLERMLVLWVDGAVNTITPALALSTNYKTQNNLSFNQYYWIPPFLSSPGDWRQ